MSEYYSFPKGSLNPVYRPEVKEKLRLSALLRHGHKDRSIPAMNQLFRSYIASAKERGFEFDITVEEFKDLTSSNCHYCDQVPKQRRRNGRLNSKYPSFYIFNGIDRVDNEIGYKLSNCVPCCKLCNKMKRANTVDVFISQAIKIAKKHGGI